MLADPEQTGNCGKLLGVVAWANLSITDMDESAFRNLFENWHHDV
jgi:hypothetical protein